MLPAFLLCDIPKTISEFRRARLVNEEIYKELVCENIDSRDILLLFKESYHVYMYLKTRNNPELYVDKCTNYVSSVFSNRDYEERAQKDAVPPFFYDSREGKLCIYLLYIYACIDKSQNKTLIDVIRKKINPFACKKAFVEIADKYRNYKEEFLLELDRKSINEWYFDIDEIIDCENIDKDDIEYILRNIDNSDKQRETYEIYRKIIEDKYKRISSKTEKNGEDNYTLHTLQENFDIYYHFENDRFFVTNVRIDRDWEKAIANECFGPEKYDMSDNKPFYTFTKRDLCELTDEEAIKKLEEAKRKNVYKLCESGVLDMYAEMLVQEEEDYSEYKREEIWVRNVFCDAEFSDLAIPEERYTAYLRLFSTDAKEPYYEYVFENINKLSTSQIEYIYDFAKAEKTLDKLLQSYTKTKYKSKKSDNCTESLIADIPLNTSERLTIDDLTRKLNEANAKIESLINKRNDDECEEAVSIKLNARKCIALFREFGVAYKKITQTDANNLLACLTQKSPTSFHKFWSADDVIMKKACKWAKELKDKTIS